MAFYAAQANADGPVQSIRFSWAARKFAFTIEAAPNLKTICLRLAQRLAFSRPFGLKRKCALEWSATE